MSLIGLALLCQAPLRVKVDPIVEQVFVSKKVRSSELFDTFRIPALARTNNGTLLAFAEGRRSGADQSANVIVLKRKLPGNEAWEPLQVVHSFEGGSLNNPCVIASASGRIYLMDQLYPAASAEFTAKPGYDPGDSCQSFLLTSDDQGLTWSKPVDVSRLVKRPDVRSVASGPGVGVEVSTGPHKGRLVFPFNQGSGRAWNDYAVFSDDEGTTWKRGATCPRPGNLSPNEVQFVETAGGGLLMNARDQGAGQYRLISRSADDGETWSPVKQEPNLPDPRCMGSVCRLGWSPGFLVFSNPGLQTRRQNGTLSFSFDEGDTWGFCKLVWPGSFEYSCLCPLSSHAVGMLFESTEPALTGGNGYVIRYVKITFTSPSG